VYLNLNPISDISLSKKYVFFNERNSRYEDLWVKNFRNLRILYEQPLTRYYHDLYLIEEQKNSLLMAKLAIGMIIGAVTTYDLFYFLS
jgi:hypothetical protein